MSKAPFTANATSMKYHFLVAFLFLVVCTSIAQQSISLPRSIPEKEGVSSQGIIDFLNAIPNSNNEFHSFMIVRHGKVIAEGWWNPYRSNLKHTMYSVSKSFTATAVGFAVSEGKLSLDDKVVSFFPADIPDSIGSYVSQLHVKDLLTMSVGQQPDPTGDIGSKNDNWVAAFIRTPILYQPGSRFLYNSAATFMLSAIVQKVTVQREFDYLQSRLFAPLGITGIDWEVNPQKINTGGWGLRLKTEDMAKFGQLFLQKGKWNGKQIVPAAWVEQASTKKIDQDPTASQAKRDSSDWLQGYCYQMWRSRNNAYRADGAFGQFIIIMPDKDAVVVITSETPNMQAEFNLVWKYIFPALHDEKLPENATGYTELTKKTKALALPIMVSKPSPLQSSISGKTFSASSNDAGYKSIGFSFHNGKLNVQLSTDTSQYNIAFASGKWESGETKKRGPYLSAPLRGNRSELSSYKVAGSYYWQSDSTLVMTLRYIESPHTETIRCKFDGANVNVEFENSFNKTISTRFVGVVE